MTTYAIEHTTTHPQWGAPMSYHALVRAEFDLDTEMSNANFASYYSKEAYAAGSQPMAYTNISVPGSELKTEQSFLNAIVGLTDTALSGGSVIKITAPPVETIP